MAARKPSQTLLTNSVTVEKKFPNGMVTCYAARSPVVHVAVTDTMAAEIRESLNFMMEHAMAAPIWQPRFEGTDLSFATPSKMITSFCLLIRSRFYLGP